MNKAELLKIISNNVSWLQTMKQPRGYCGPVIHYWQDCLNYIGPSLNWCYEGLISAYLNVFEKTEDKKFLDLAIEAGNHLVNNQFSNGSFFNSDFERNPSLRSGGTPHETSASIGLVNLSNKLKELNLNYEPYLLAAKKNLDLFHIRDLYDKETGLFFQYRYDPTKLHVPNKIATIIELLILMHNATKDKSYLKFIDKNADFILNQQNEDDMSGGIFQTDKENKIITFYTARCIPALLKVYELTKKSTYLDAAIKAADFIVNMQDKKTGGYFFGYIKNEEWNFYKYPIFVAGSADIIRALLLLRPYKHYKVGDAFEFIIKNINENGSIRTSYGMNLKNKDTNEYDGKPFWRDVIPVVGWNDKSLRLFSELMEKGEIVIHKIEPITVECEDATYNEDENLIKIVGNENYVFNKKDYFSRKDKLQRLILNSALLYTNIRKGYGKDRKFFDYILR